MLSNKSIDYWIYTSPICVVVCHNINKDLTAKCAKNLPGSQRTDIESDTFCALCAFFAISAVKYDYDTTPCRPTAGNILKSPYHETEKLFSLFRAEDLEEG